MVYFDDNRLLATLLPSWRDLLRAPRAFFRDLPPTPYYRGSILLITAISALSCFATVPFSGALMLFLFPVVWVTMVIGLLLWARFLSWGVRVLGKRKLAPSNALLLSCYACVPLVLGFVPWIGLPASLWSLYLMWIGLIERAGISAALAAGLIVVPVVLPVVLLVALLALFPQAAELLTATYSISP